MKSSAIIHMARNGQDTFPRTVPLRVRLDFYLQIPMSQTLKWRQKAEKNLVRPTKKPDIDNLAKAVCDALNSTAWYDDSQLCELTVAKWWALEPGVRIVVEAMEMEEDEHGEVSADDTAEAEHGLRGVHERADGEGCEH